MHEAARSLLLGLIILAVLAPPAVWAVGLARRQRGGAAVLAGLLLIFGVGFTLFPPPPPVGEFVRRDEDGDDKDA
jgi:hypothetical protein